MKYYFAHKERRISLGLYPEISLKDARKLKDISREDIAHGVDPLQKRRIESQAQTFNEVQTEWFEKNKVRWSKKHCEDVLQRLRDYLLPTIGKRPIKLIEPPEILSCLRPIEKKA